MDAMEIDLEAHRNCSDDWWEPMTHRSPNAQRSDEPGEKLIFRRLITAADEIIGDSIGGWSIGESMMLAWSFDYFQANNKSSRIDGLGTVSRVYSFRESSRNADEWHGGKGFEKKVTKNIFRNVVLTFSHSQVFFSS